jgi:3'(2'), 5'-bisphosphate nucleotidase/inositol polyphosphate 1-phosphatase
VAAEIGLQLPSLRLDSQAKYGALSRGDASIFMRFPDPSYREKIWDHCAGVAIIEVRRLSPMLTEKAALA